MNVASVPESDGKTADLAGERRGAGPSADKRLAGALLAARKNVGLNYATESRPTRSKIRPEMTGAFGPISAIRAVRRPIRVLIDATSIRLAIMAVFKIGER